VRPPQARRALVGDYQRRLVATRGWLSQWHDAPVLPDSLQDFFVASAGVAGALIGLLFVAISVAQDRLTSENADPIHQVRAAAALTAFTNALTISLFALISNSGIAWASVSVGIVGVLFIAGSLVSLLREREAHRTALRDATFLIGQLLVFGLQIRYGLRLVANGHDIDAAQAIATLVVVCFLVGISRSWELVGGPSFSFLGQSFAFVRHRRDRSDSSD
jgi:hypothetical protein